MGIGKYVSVFVCNVSLFVSHCDNASLSLYHFLVNMYQDMYPLFVILNLDTYHIFCDNVAFYVAHCSLGYALQLNGSRWINCIPLYLFS